MRTLKVSIDNEVMTSDEAAEFLEITKAQLLSNLARNENNFKFRGFEVKRVSPVRHRLGTKIICAATREEWDSISEFCKSIHAKPSQVEAAIKAEQKVVINGRTYFAPNYKVIHRIASDERAKKLQLDEKVQRPILQQIEVPKKPEPINEVSAMLKEKLEQLSTEQRCFNLLQQLAIERIRKTEYDKATKVLNALEMLSN